MREALAALAFYLFVPMTVTSFVWWAAGLGTLPFQAALAWVVGSTVVLVRDEPTGPRRTRLVVGAVAAFVVGLLFFEKSLVILPVALVVALLAVRHDRRVGSLLTAVFSRAGALGGDGRRVRRMGGAVLHDVHHGRR